MISVLALFALAATVTAVCVFPTLSAFDGPLKPQRPMVAWQDNYSWLGASRRRGQSVERFL